MEASSSSSSNSSIPKVLKRANPRTIQDKFLVQYDATYTCPRDGRPIPGNLNGWHGWFYNAHGVLHPSFDLMPDVSEYNHPELHPAPSLPLPDGEEAKLFSSRHPKTILRHFDLMAKHGIDGVFLTRKAVQLETEDVYDSPKAELTKWRDDIGQMVEVAAEREGRCFAMSYDVHHVHPTCIAHTILVDWQHLVRDQAILESSAYLRESGRPVLLIKGFPFDDPAADLQIIANLIQLLRVTTPGGIYVILGVPMRWREHNVHSSANRTLLDIIKSSADAIVPTTFGRYNESSFDEYAEDVMAKDMQYLQECHEQDNSRKVDYIPTVWPGLSVKNLTAGKEGINSIRRDGGKFLWRQCWYAKRLGARSVIGMSWDCYNDGSAMLPTVTLRRLLPAKGEFLALDQDGYDVPQDWYMRICGMAAEGVRGERRTMETFPVKELHDYWSSRPKYEELQDKKEEGSSSGAHGGNDAWKTAAEPKGDEPPPPPYSLESALEATGSSSGEGGDVPHVVPSPSQPIRQLPERPQPSPSHSAMYAPAAGAAAPPSSPPLHGDARWAGAGPTYDSAVTTPPPPSSSYYYPVREQIPAAVQASSHMHDGGNHHPANPHPAGQPHSGNSPYVSGTASPAGSQSEHHAHSGHLHLGGLLHIGHKLAHHNHPHGHADPGTNIAHEHRDSTASQGSDSVDSLASSFRKQSLHSGQSPPMGPETSGPWPPQDWSASPNPASQPHQSGSGSSSPPAHALPMSVSSSSKHHFHLHAPHLHHAHHAETLPQDPGSPAFTSTPPPEASHHHLLQHHHHKDSHPPAHTHTLPPQAYSSDNFSNVPPVPGTSPYAENQGGRWNSSQTHMQRPPMHPHYNSYPQQAPLQMANPGFTTPGSVRPPHHQQGFDYGQYPSQMQSYSPPPDPSAYHPPPPPTHSSVAAGQYTSNQSFPHRQHSNSTPAIPFLSSSSVRNTLDRYAGEDRRKQLEHHADGLLQTGTKLFNKFQK